MKESLQLKRLLLSQDGIKYLVKVSESVIDASALRIVRTLLAFQQAEDPMRYDRSLNACDAHTKLALEVAEKSVTLLKNDHNTLPFDETKVKNDLPSAD